MKDILRKICVNSHFYVLCLVYLLVWPASNAQYLKDKSVNDFNTLTVEDGLSQNTINTILKDNIGYMWFGSNSGLNRYNGYEIEIIGDVDASSNSLANSQILDLYEYSLGVVWIATHNGLFNYNTEKEKLHFVDATQQNGIPFHIYCLQPEGNNKYWLGTSDGLLLFDKENGIVEEYRHKPYQSYTVSSSNILAMANGKDELWVGTEAGLNIFDKRNKSFQRFGLGSSTNIKSERQRIRAVEISEDGNIWIGTEFDGLYIYTPNTNHFV